VLSSRIMRSSPGLLNLPGSEAPGVDLALILETHAAAGESPGEPGSLWDPERGEACWSQQFALWLEDLQAELPAICQAKCYSLSLSLVDDAGMADLNRQWRQVQGPTDVLAFAALEQAPPQPEPARRADILADSLELGDIVISLDSAMRQAREAGHELKRELLFLASHGLLHLLGWDHPDEASLEAMLARQERLMQLAATSH
jgi:probable rRNA maturation factor